MESLFLLIPLSVLLVFLIGALFWWSLRSGQFDDLEGPGYRVLMDDDKPAEKPSANSGIKPENPLDQRRPASEHNKTDTLG